ncbi:MAG: ABC transporter ATP-binding protein [Fibrobacteria bacterium]|nr:ABC transporter ATP-binding protein [Fibrobacteria bacterium]
MNADNSNTPVTPLLSIRDLSVNFGEGSHLSKAVIDLNMEVRPGEIVGLIGESGSGKTTSAHAILGILDGLPGVCSGEAEFNGHPLLPSMNKYVKISGNKIKKQNTAFQKKQFTMMHPLLGRKIAAIFQEPKSALNPYLSIKEHLLESISRSGKKIKSPESFGKDILSQVGIVDCNNVWNQYPHQLSGGMAQRVMIAMALSCSPKLIIADEPTTALDVTTQAKLLELLLKFQKEMDLSILIISHDIGVIREVANRVYVMYKGKIVEEGNIMQIINAPQAPYTQKLLQAFYNLAGEV